MPKPLALVCAGLFALGTSARAQQATQIVLLAHEVLWPDSAAAFDTNERRIAQTCVRLGCPHPYLAAVPLTSPGSPTDVWRINVFPSRDAMSATERAWTRPALRSALAPLSARKTGFRRSLTSVTLTGPLTAYPALDLAQARFVVLRVEHQRGAFSGDSLTADIQATNTEVDAQTRATRLRSASALVLRIVPEWSVPDPQWARADGPFWRRGVAIPP